MKKILIAAVAALMALTSCMKDQVYSYPSVGKPTQTDAYFDTDVVTVTATVSALVEITKVELCYTIGTNASQTVAMTGNAGTYTGTIPAADVGTKVTYYIIAYTASGFTQTDPKSYTVGDIPVDYTQLKLNELDGTRKSIELYNAGTANISLKDVKIKKDEKDGYIWTGPARLIAPGEFVLLYSSDVTGAGGAQEGYDGGLIFTSGLSSKKTVLIELFDPDGNLIDKFQRGETPWGDKIADNTGSWSRIPDGTGAWKITATITPGAANSTSGEDDPLVK